MEVGLPHLQFFGQLTVKNDHSQFLVLFLPLFGLTEKLFSLRDHSIHLLILRSFNVEAVKIHHLVPNSYKVIQELLLGVFASVDFCQSPELGV